jgi:hypothetical protein
MAARISPDDFKNLSPEARIKRLRELEEANRKELEETRKQVEQEIAAAEELIKETVDELEEGTADEVRKRESQREEENLEAKLAGERKPTEESRPQYGERAGGLYNALETAAEQLNRLYGRTSWNEQEQRTYQEAKQQVEKAKTYSLNSERLEEELGLATGMLKRLQYRN